MIQSFDIFAKIENQKSSLWSASWYNKYIATGGVDGVATVWELGPEGLEKLHSIEASSLAIVSVSSNADGI